MPATRVRRTALIVAGLTVVLLFGGGIVDAVASSGKVRRNVTLEGASVEGASKDTLRGRVVKLDATVQATPVEITAGDVSVTTTAADLGLSVDVDATVDAVMGARDPFPAVGWVTKLMGTSDVALRLRVDETTTREHVVVLDQQANDVPLEPTITLTSKGLEAVPGQPGIGLDADALVAKLHEVRYGEVPIKIAVDQVPVQPTHQLAEVQQLAADANTLTANPITVRAGDATATVGSEQLRSWVTTDLSSGVLSLALKTDLVRTDLASLLVAANHDPRDASLTLGGGRPVLTESVDGVKCCTNTAGSVVLESLRSGAASTPIDVPVEITKPSVTTEDLRALGINERVSSFTTKHKAGEPRVKNIHLAADKFRGSIIPPKGEISLNTLLGKRLAEDGYVSAPSIQDGELKPDIGGGVSQLATTLFNAAFFAGLNYGDYQSHSLYISRYPFGREATINWPSPDLVVKNPTPYGLLVWTSYTDTSITVELYSTKYVTDVHQGAQTATNSGASCISVKTDRVMTYVDGTTATDSVRARYRAREGIDCDEALPPGVGRQSVPKTSSSATTTTVAGTTTTTGAGTTTTTGAGTTTTGAGTTTTTGAGTTTTKPSVTTVPTTTTVGASTTTQPATTTTGFGP